MICIHGHGNLEKAINCLQDRDKVDFYNYVKGKNKFNPNIMYIARPEILDKWFTDVFEWLKKCETYLYKRLNRL